MEQEQREDGKTVIRNSCGHDFAYRIKRPSAVQWLKSRPCPRCAARERWDKRRPADSPDGGGDLPKTPEAPTDAGDAAEGQSPADAGDAGEAESIPPAMPEVPPPTEDEIAEILGRWPTVPKNLHHPALVDLLLLLHRGLPVWLQGPPGTSKSTLAEQAADALGLDLYPLSCHELMSRTDLFGYTDANGTVHRTPLWDAFERGGLLLLDEVDNGNPNLLGALNSALSNGHCVFGTGTVVRRHERFRVVATANTAGLGPERGFIGRLGVDAATRDRFVTVHVPIDSNLEAALAALAAEDADATAEATDTCLASSSRRLTARARIAARPPSRSVILDAVSEVRNIVDQRYLEGVVSPRTTIHVTMMTRLGWALPEALAIKLVGLTKDESAAVIDEALR